LLFAACFSFLQRQISRFGSTLTKRKNKKKKGKKTAKTSTKSAKLTTKTQKYKSIVIIII